MKKSSIAVIITIITALIGLILWRYKKYLDILKQNEDTKRENARLTNANVNSFEADKDNYVVSDIDIIPFIDKIDNPTLIELGFGLSYPEFNTQSVADNKAIALYHALYLAGEIIAKKAINLEKVLDDAVEYNTGVATFPMTYTTDGHYCYTGTQPQNNHRDAYFQANSVSYENFFNDCEARINKFAQLASELEFQKATIYIITSEKFKSILVWKDSLPSNHPSKYLTHINEIIGSYLLANP